MYPSQTTAGYQQSSTPMYPSQTTAGYQQSSTPMYPSQTTAGYQQSSTPMYPSQTTAGYQQSSMPIYPSQTTAGYLQRPYPQDNTVGYVQTTYQRGTDTQYSLGSTADYPQETTTVLARQASPTVIFVMGETGVGKSTFIRWATGRNVGIDPGLESCKTKHANCLDLEQVS
jgi:hypothetical protein